MSADMAAHLRALRDAAARLGVWTGDDEVDEIVRWQMTGLLTRKAPVYKRQPFPRCRHCAGEWHGLPQDGCAGSYEE